MYLTLLPLPDFVEEYGTTISEKRSVGVKICHGLLEKIKFDLGVARTDNEVEPMRFMINTDYSQDLPINTMGRRIRTRLYFTSESHLHTVLNVLRFANNDGKPILSNLGAQIVNNSPELCYLTHIVMRVFEDSRPEMQDDARRFRVEILFSPGATATPLHLHETDRETDSSRFDTAPLQVIGREGLSCEELEAFFGRAIIAGRSDDEEYPEAASMSTMPERIRSPTKEKKRIATDIPTKKESSSSNEVEDSEPDYDPLPSSPSQHKATNENSVTAEVTEDQRPNSTKELSEQPAMKAAIERDIPLSITDEDVVATVEVVDEVYIDDKQSDSSEDDDDTSMDTLARVRKAVARKHFWTTVAVGSFVLGASCLFIAMRLTDDSRQRRWSSRRYSR